MLQRSPVTPRLGAAPARLPTWPTGLADSFGRRVTYLRVSLTDRCNYRCVYCLPEAGFDHLNKSELLDFEEITRVVKCFARLGVRRVRLTGGEPTVRRGLPELVRKLAAITQIDEVCMTTNGHLLAPLARPLRDAGLHTLNVSLDSLSADRFRTITRGGDLHTVLGGIQAARAAGFPRLRLNVVAMRGVNDDELGALCGYAWQRDIVPRFIEWMPMSVGEAFDANGFLPASEIRAAIERQAGGRLVPHGEFNPGQGPARYFQLESSGGGQSDNGATIGVISALTENFCASCNRVRMTAAGELHSCLARDDATSLRDVLRAGGDDDAVIRAIEAAVYAKREGHEFSATGCGGPRKIMMSIGG
jgi:GTP 3',8-cyclase